MKKRILGALALAGGVFALASCDGGQIAAFECPEAFDTETPVTIEFWHTMSADKIQPTLEEAISEFKLLYPNVTIEHEQIGGYDDVRDQINKNMGTGDYPTMAYCYPDHVALYNEAGITVALDNLISNEKYGLGGSDIVFKDIAPKKEDYVSSFYAEGSKFEDGLTYIMPFLKSTEALYYNKTFFDENKLTVPTTWPELWETCAKIKEIDKNATPLGYDSESNLFITLAEAYGYEYTKAEGDYFYFNNEGMRNLMKEFRENYDKGYFTTETLNGTYTNNLMTDLTMKSRAYMCIGSTAGASYQVNAAGAFETGVAAIPKAPGKELKCISQGPSISFFNKENPQEVLAAWLFYQYLTTPATQAKFAFATGYLPVTTTATEIKAYKDFLAGAAGNKNGITALATKQALAQRDYCYTSAVFIGSSAARDEVANIVVQVMSDASINSSNIDAKIKSWFDAAIEECKYQAGIE